MLIGVGVTATLFAPLTLGAPKMKEVAFLNVELEGSKIWLPGVLVLKREEVKLKLSNKHKDPHGFAIDELAVQIVVEGASTKDLILKPARAGTFRLWATA